MTKSAHGARLPPLVICEQLFSAGLLPSVESEQGRPVISVCQLYANDGKHHSCGNQLYMLSASRYARARPLGACEHFCACMKSLQLCGGMQ